MQGQTLGALKGKKGWLNHQLAMLVKYYSIWPESWELKATPMPTGNSRPYES